MKHPPAIRVQLIHIYGIMKGEIQEFSQETISIGRNLSCDLCFPKDLTIISRKHAEIIREGNQFKLIDYSSNGTFVNGKSIKEVYLKAGDVIEFSEGGPKVSFLTQIKEITQEDNIIPPSRESAETMPEKLQTDRTEENKEIKEAHNKPVEILVQETPVSLFIQYGPAIHSFKQLPVAIGKHPKCNFIPEHPSIFDQHAQIFFFENKYWIKDLTGQKLVQINNRPIEFQAPIEVNDRVSLSPQGPVFCFVGFGRLAELTEPVIEQQYAPLEKTEKIKEVEGASRKDGFFSKLKKII